MKTPKVNASIQFKCFNVRSVCVFKHLQKQLILATASIDTSEYIFVNFVCVFHEHSLMSNVRTINPYNQKI